MKTSPPGAAPHRRRFTASEREQLLTELDRSGLTLTVNRWPAPGPYRKRAASATVPQLANG